MPIAPPPGASLARRYGTYVAGLVLVGTGVAVTVRAEVGVAPFDVLTTGTAAITGVPLAVTAVLVPAEFTVLGLVLRGPFGPGTVVAIATVGPVIGAVLHVVPALEHLGVRTVAFALGASVIAVGIILVVVGDVGAGPSELVMLAIHQRGVDLAVARTGIEVSCVGLGWVLGGQVGAGTVVFAVAIGPVLRTLLRVAGTGGRETWPPTAPPRSPESGRGHTSAEPAPSCPEPPVGGTRAPNRHPAAPNLRSGARRSRTGTQLPRTSGRGHGGPEPAHRCPEPRRGVSAWRRRWGGA